MTRAETIGTLVLFWHDSQERGVWRAPKEELLRFIPFTGDDRIGVFESLVNHEYISLCDDGEYVIHGNRKHIEALDERREAAREGGRAKARKINENKASLAHGRKSLPPAKSALPNSIQFNSIQSNINTPSQQAARFDFESLYEKYPRKVGKAAGLRKAKVQIKTLEAYEELRTAIARYTNYCIAQKTEPRFIKHFSSFMSDWRDWLDPGAGSSHSEPTLKPIDLEAI